MFCSANWDAAPWNFGKLRAKTLMMIGMPITSERTSWGIDHVPLSQNARKDFATLTASATAFFSISSGGCPTL
jgi:hypothetical protein